MSRFTPEELASVGYVRPSSQPQSDNGELASVGNVPPTSQVQAPIRQSRFTPEELASVGYVRPTTQAQSPIPIQTGNDVLQGARDASRAIIGEIGSLGAGAVENVGKLVGSQPLQSFGAERRAMGDQMVSEARDRSPIAGGIGKYGTDIAGILATTPSSITGMAAGGALAGLATGTDSNPMTAIAEGAAIGGALGGAGKLVSTVAKDLIAGGTVRWAAFNNTEGFTNAVTKATLQKVGGKAEDMTPSDLLAAISKTEKEVKVAKNDLYTARNAEASAQGVTVQRSNLAQVVNALRTQQIKSSSVELDAAVRAGDKALKDNSALTFTEADTAANTLSGAAYDANVAGKHTKARLLSQLSNALNDDIAKATESKGTVNELHKAADAFNANVYSPIRDLKAQKILADKFSETKALATFVNGKILNKQEAFQALQRADPDYAGKIVSANVNALKEAATTDGKINLDMYAKSLEKELKIHGKAYGPAFDDMITLSRTLNAAAVSSHGLKGSALEKIFLVGSGVGGFLVGGFHGAVAGAALGKAPFLYAAGKMVRNPAAQQLLKAARRLEKYPDSALAKEVQNKIGKNFMNQFKDIPIRLAPAFGVSALQDKNPS